MDDRALIAAIRSGHPEAFAWFIAGFGAIVHGLCFRMMRHQQDAEDLTQETFLRAFQALDRFDSDRPIRPWLLQIAANRCRTALASRTQGLVVADLTWETPDPRPGLLDPDDLSGELDRAIERLRPDYRLAFTLFHEQGLPYEEIAEILDRPTGTVKSWLHRARIELADDLGRRGIRC